jgi:hypothetical protein
VKHLIALAVLAPCLLVLPAAAQDSGNDRWQLTLDNGQYVWDIRLVRLDGDQLVYRQADTLGMASVAHITEIRRIGKTEMHLGEGGAGGAMGALTGADDEVFDLAALDYATRLRAVQQILVMHPPPSSP